MRKRKSREKEGEREKGSQIRLSPCFYLPTPLFVPLCCSVLRKRQKYSQNAPNERTPIPLEWSTRDDPDYFEAIAFKHDDIGRSGSHTHCSHTHRAPALNT